MDLFLARLGQQVFNAAVRSGIAMTSNLVLKKCNQLITSTRGQNSNVMIELAQLQKQLDGRIGIVSHAVDLIQLRSLRGNPSLEAALPLATALHQDIASLGDHLSAAMEASDDPTAINVPDMHEIIQRRLENIATEMKDLISRIDREIPLLQLAITTSGESLSATLSPGVSPSRFLQASAFINLGDTQFASNPTRAVEIGPSFVLSLYMLFLGHANQTSTTEDPSNKQPLEPYGFGDGARKPLWQEVVHKARVRILRTPLSWEFNPLVGHEGPSPGNTARPNGYSYHLEFIEDLNDGRCHDEESLARGGFGNMLQAGIRESVPVHQISKIFYADTGRILNVGSDAGSDNPVLLLKRDVRAAAPAVLPTACLDASHSRLSGTDGSCDEQDEIDKQIDGECIEQVRAMARMSESLRFPSHLDKEWMALEIFQDDTPCDDPESDDDVNHDDAAFRDTPAKTKGLKDAADKNKPSEGAQSCDPASFDTTLLEQMRNICLEQGHIAAPARGSPVSTKVFLAGSPFAAVTTSLSLLEMLIRLSSLQESQQSHHLTTSDAVLNFFLEETSTNGLTRD